jgi:hypothetical protein
VISLQTAFPGRTIMTGFVIGNQDGGGVGNGQRSFLPMEMRMKTFASAFALSALFANAASATKFEMSEHAFTQNAHVEVLNGDHSKPSKRK